MLRLPALRVRAFSLFLPLVLLLTACGGGAQQAGPPTNTPIPSATPRSTPLPPLDTPVPLGDASNPLVILVVSPPAGESEAEPPAAPTETPQEPPTATPPAEGEGEATAEPTLDVTATPDLASLPLDVALETLLLERSGLAVDVVLVNSDSEINAQLCGTAPVVGWVDGLSALVVQAQGCASPALLVERAGALGTSYDILISARAASGGLRAVRDGALCRLGADDFASWFVPSLMLYRAGIDPLGDTLDLLDVADYDALVSGIVDGTCVVGGVPQGFLAGFPSDVSEQVEVVETSPAFPYGVMMYAGSVPSYLQQRLNAGLLDIAADAQAAAILRALLQQDTLRRFSDAGTVWGAFQAFVNETGLDLAALGE